MRKMSSERITNNMDIRRSLFYDYLDDKWQCALFIIIIKILKNGVFFQKRKENLYAVRFEVKMLRFGAFHGDAFIWCYDKSHTSKVNNIFKLMIIAMHKHNEYTAVAITITIQLTMHIWCQMQIWNWIYTAVGYFYLL